jgi:hypothetical protein
MFVDLFLKIYLFIICKYTVAIFRHSRRGRQILLQMIVSHHVVAGIWTLDLWKSSRVLLPTEPSHQPCLWILAIKNTVGLGMVAHTFILALRRQRQADFWVPGQPGLQSEFQDSQGSTEKPCLRKKKKKGK